jgi:glycosyltransferase involved in cell wall biosynthesis
LYAYERAACGRFPELFVCAEPDRVAIGAPNISVVRTCADLEHFAYRREGRTDNAIVMTGNQGYQPNIDAVAWFASDVWPRVRAVRPNATFRIVGVRPAPATRALEGKHGITVTGPVDDVATELHRATLAVCPMRGGSGLQTKVVEAMATGTPVVATTFGNEGIGAQPGSEIAIADDPAAFAAAVLALLADPAARDRQAAAAHAYGEREFTWAGSARKIEEAYARATQPQATGTGSQNLDTAVLPARSIIRE